MDSQGQSDAYKFQYEENKKNEKNEKDERSSKFIRWMEFTILIFVDKIDGECLKAAVRDLPKSHFTDKESHYGLECFPNNDASLICTDENDQGKIKRMAYALVRLFLIWWSDADVLVQNKIKTSIVPCDKHEEQMFRDSKLESSFILENYLRSLNESGIQIIELYINRNRARKFAHLTPKSKASLLSQLNLQSCVRVFTFLQTQCPLEEDGEKFRSIPPDPLAPYRKLSGKLFYYGFSGHEMPLESIDLLSPLLGFIGSKLTDRIFRKPTNAEKTFNRMVLDIGNPPVPFVDSFIGCSPTTASFGLDAVRFCDDDCREEGEVDARRILEMYSEEDEFLVLPKEVFREKRNLAMGLERLFMAFALRDNFNTRGPLLERLKAGRQEICQQEKYLEQIFGSINSFVPSGKDTDRRRGAAIILNINRAYKRLAILLRALSNVDELITDLQHTEGGHCISTLERVSRELESVTKMLLDRLRSSSRSPLHIVALGRNNKPSNARWRVVHAEIDALVRFIKSLPLKTRSVLFPNVETYGRQDWDIELICPHPNDQIMKPLFDSDILFDFVWCLDSWKKAVEHIKPLSTPPVLASVEYLKSFSINSAMFDILILEYDNDNCSFSNSQACPMCITALSKCGIGKQIYSSITCGLETMTINHDPKVHSQALDDALMDSGNLSTTAN